MQKTTEKLIDPYMLGRLFLCLLIIVCALAGINGKVSTRISSFGALFFLSILNLWNGYEVLMTGNRKKARFLWLSGVISFALSFGILL